MIARTDVTSDMVREFTLRKKNRAGDRKSKRKVKSNHQQKVLQDAAVQTEHIHGITCKVHYIKNSFVFDPQNWFKSLNQKISPATPRKLQIETMENEEI